MWYFQSCMAYGEDGTVQGLLEWLSSRGLVLTSSVGMDKDHEGTLQRGASIVKHVVVGRKDWETNRKSLWISSRSRSAIPASSNPPT